MKQCAGAVDAVLKKNRWQTSPPPAITISISALVARVRTLVLMLRYSGLRIRDAITLVCARMQDGRLFLYTAKTGTVVRCPLPPLLMAGSQSIEAIIFLEKESKPQSAVVTGSAPYIDCFLAEMRDGREHQLNDAPAWSLLAGAPRAPFRPS